jgi:predicted lysophospholipase L1 biosynthesis ABC-type transport system permease subunit
MIEQWWLLIPGFFALGVGVAAARYAATRQERAAMLALLAALGASLLVNDSPGPVMIGGLTAIFGLEAGVVHRFLAVPVLRRLLPARPVLEQ